MFQYLENLICNLNVQFFEYVKIWKRNASYNKINLKKKLVKDINLENNLIETIYAYQSFLLQETANLELSLKEQTTNSKIYTRIKTPDSIRYKIENYTNNKPEKGNIPICKCLNDIFGIRIIHENDIDINQIKKFFVEKNLKLKCIDSSNGVYKAVHIYFVNTNYDFPWELQIWKKEDEQTNINSHAKFKQYYTKWVTGRRI